MNKILLTILFMTISFPCFPQGHTTKIYNYESFIHPSKIQKNQTKEKTIHTNSINNQKSQTLNQIKNNKVQKSSFNEWVDFLNKAFKIIIFLIIGAVLTSWSYNCPGY